MVIARNSAPRTGPCVEMLSVDSLVLPLLAGIGAFALVGLIWSLTEGFIEERRKDQR